MSSTNKTANLELSQFIGTDKPAWLTDYNADMNKIDTGVHTAQTTATGADGKATANTTAIGDLTDLTTTAKNDLVSAVNEVKTASSAAQTAANSAATNANSALTKATALENALDINTFGTLTWTTNIGNIGGNPISFARNADGSLAKIYGYMRITNSASTTTITLTSSDTGLRPSSAITFNNCGFRQTIYNVNIQQTTQQIAVPYTTDLTYTIGTDGRVTVTIPNSTSIVEHNISFIACTLFIKDFGDES